MIDTIIHFTSAMKYAEGKVVIFFALIEQVKILIERN